MTQMLDWDDVCRIFKRCGLSDWDVAGSLGDRPSYTVEEVRKALDGTDRSDKVIDNLLRKSKS